RRVGEAGAGEHDPVDHVDGALEARAFAHLVLDGVEQEQQEVLLVGGLLHAGDELGEVGVGEVGDLDAEAVVALGTLLHGRGGGAVVELFRSGHHGGVGGGADASGAGEGAGDGGGGDARELGDVVDRHSLLGHPAAPSSPLPALP